MKKKRVFVLGGTGMLGSMVADVLAAESSLDVHVTARMERMADATERGHRALVWHSYKYGQPLGDLFTQPYEWVVNCIGATKPRITAEPSTIRSAVRVNVDLPFDLAEIALKNNTRVIQIATDCVFTGLHQFDHGVPYNEKSRHDAHNVYGMTKSLGEVTYANVHHLRCSIIGPEPFDPHRYLFEWVRDQRDNPITGYTTHQWNGITTLAFAKIVRGLILTNNAASLGNLQHIVPADSVTKADLLRMIKSEFGFDPQKVIDQRTDQIDMRLTTISRGRNDDCWIHAGYEGGAPTILSLVSELAANLDPNVTRFRLKTTHKETTR